MNNLRLKAYLPYLLSVAALVVFVIFLAQNAERLYRLLNFSVINLFFLITLVLAAMTMNGLINYILYRTLGAPISLNESVGLAALNTLANQLPFAGGMVAKSVYLKRRYALAYMTFFGATTVLSILFISSSGLIGLSVVFYLFLWKNHSSAPLVPLFFLLLTLSAMLLWLPLEKLPLKATWRTRLFQLMNSWRAFRHEVTAITAIIIIRVCMTILFAGRYWVTFRMMSQDVPLAQCVLFSAATVLTQLVPITPDGLGVREAIVATMASFDGITPDVSIVVVAIDRLVATTVVIAVGTGYSYFLSKIATETVVAGGGNKANSG